MEPDHVLNQSVDDTESPLNRAQHAEYGEIREARELWVLGYTDDDVWKCVDKKCGVRMIPCAWERPNASGDFCYEDGRPYRRIPYFRADPVPHIKGCKASLYSGSPDRSEPENSIGSPVEYPNRVILFSVPNHDGSSSSDESASRQPLTVDNDRRHARWSHGIREACEFYIDQPDQHWCSLRVDRCPGATYDKCFVRLGTGEPMDAGRNWIFYDEIRLFGSWIDLDAEPLVLPLLGTVNKVSRRLVVPTSRWLPGYRHEFRQRLKAGLMEGRAAYKEGRGQRPWIFFFGQEKVYDQIEFSAHIQPGVEVLVRAMPRLRWNYRPSATFVKSNWQRPSGENNQPQPPSTDANRAAIDPPAREPVVSMQSTEQHLADVEDAGDRPHEVLVPQWDIDIQPLFSDECIEAEAPVRGPTEADTELELDRTAQEAMPVPEIVPATDATKKTPVAPPDAGPPVSVPPPIGPSSQSLLRGLLTGVTKWLLLRS